MATITQISAEEYFRLPHAEREAEFVHGVVVERTMPDFLHSHIQAQLAYLLKLALQQHKGYYVCTELRMRVDTNIIRLLDLCLLDYKADPDSAPTRPPLLAVEIVSKDDSYTGLLTKLREYHNWGVPNVWLIDPGLGQLARYETTGLIEVNELTLSEFQFAVTLKDLLP